MSERELRIDDMRLRVCGIDAADAPQFARAVYEQLALRRSRVTSGTNLGALQLRVPTPPNAGAVQIATSVAAGIVKGIR